MFSWGEAARQVSKEEFEAQEPRLRVDLINAQYDLRKASFPVFLVIAGNDRIGCNHLIDRLHEWMDARYIDTHVFGTPTREERDRPRFWRYWTSLPPKGKIAILSGAWPLNAVAERVTGELGKQEYAKRLDHIRQFEREHAEDGALILKFWIDVPHQEMKKRLKAARKDPNRIWWMEDIDWSICEHHDDVTQPVEQLIETTTTPHAPWFVVDGTHDRHRDLEVTTTIRSALQTRLRDEVMDNSQPEKDNTPPMTSRSSALQTVDLSASLEKDEYREQLEKYRRKLNRVMRVACQQRRTAVLVFEGWDAAGKGGVIRRITGALPARSYKLVPIAAPSVEEKKYHYLWRFWNQVPRGGQLLIFDRSWYGRVLVERVEQFATEPEWRRAFDEINDFEQQLVDDGIPVLKFWLHISPQEQLSRFQAREQMEYKKHKITAEDYRNRAKWDEYAAAVDDMVARTSTSFAPWHLVPANSKRFARIRVLKTVCKALKKAWDG